MTASVAEIFLRRFVDLKHPEMKRFLRMSHGYHGLNSPNLASFQVIFDSLHLHSIRGTPMQGDTTAALLSKFWKKHHKCGIDWMDKTNEHGPKPQNHSEITPPWAPNSCSISSAASVCMFVVILAPDADTFFCHVNWEQHKSQATFSHATKFLSKFCDSISTWDNQRETR
jgi:hypothetical protein